LHGFAQAAETRYVAGAHREPLSAVDGGEREILGRISPEKRSRPAQGSEPAAKLLWRRVAMRGSSHQQVSPPVLNPR